MKNWIHVQSLSMRFWGQHVNKNEKRYWNCAKVTKMTVKIGILGGSGLEDPEIFQQPQASFVDTPFGTPSDALLCGKISGVDCVLLSRHGRGHKIGPSSVNYRANIWALKEAGCTHVLATTCCGSLQEPIHPGEVVFLDQYIDRTYARKNTFYDATPGGPEGVCHIPMHEPFCERTRKLLIETASFLGIECHPSGTTVCIEGPKFSSRAESFLYKSWGGTVVNMTTVPEVCLAKEVGLCYAALALPTDYDSWHDRHAPVTVQMVLESLEKNRQKALRIIIAAVPKIAATDWSEVFQENAKIVKTAVMGV